MTTSNKPPEIIGIAGTNGCGKDTVGRILSLEHNYLFISVTDLLREELVYQGKSTERSNMRELSASWRREKGLGVLVDKAMEIYQAVKTKYDGIAMASLRNPGEVDKIHDYGGLVIWIDGDPRLRYDRLQANATHRGPERAVDDDKTYDQFLAEEAAEMDVPPGGDESNLSVSAVKAKADKFLINEGYDLAELGNKLNLLLGF